MQISLWWSNYSLKDLRRDLSKWNGLKTHPQIGACDQWTAIYFNLTAFILIFNIISFAASPDMVPSYHSTNYWWPGNDKNMCYCMQVSWGDIFNWIHFTIKHVSKPCPLLVIALSNTFILKTSEPNTGMWKLGAARYTNVQSAHKTSKEVSRKP